MSSARTLISPAQLARPRGKFLCWVVFALVVGLFTVVFLGPLYWMVSGGLKTTQEIVQSPPTFVPETVHPENYSRAWHVMDLSRLLVNTLYYAFEALAFQLVLDVAAAYSLSRLRPVFGKAILAMMLVTLMIPATVLVLPPGFGDGPLRWLPSAQGGLAFTRTDGLIIVVNLTREPAGLPGHTSVLLTSGPLDDEGRLPQDTAAWLRS